MTTGFDPAGSRVLITGATGGLGEALARAFAAAGADLLLSGRDRGRLTVLAESLRGAGRTVAIVNADLTREDDLASLVAAARDFQIDVLVNNAGALAFGLYEDQSWPEIARLLETNLAAPMRLTGALLPWLRTRPRAAIVNVGSTFGSLPFPGFAGYSASKAGLRGFSRALRRELADSAITVVHVAPRAIATPLNPPAVDALNRALRSHVDLPEAAARGIVAALRAGCGLRHLGFPERLFAWLDGVAPAVIDRALAGKLATIRRFARPIDTRKETS